MQIINARVVKWYPQAKPEKKEKRELVRGLKRDEQPTADTKKKGGGSPVPMGVSVCFDNLLPGLTDGEEVMMRRTTGFKPAKAHGTTVFWSYGHNTYKVHEPTELDRDRANMVQYEKGLPIVKPEKLTGKSDRDNSGVTWDQFVIDHGVPFAMLVKKGIDMAHAAEAEKQAARSAA